MPVAARTPRRPRLTARAWIHAQSWAIRRLHSMHRTRSASHLETGTLGEREALFHLRLHGYIVVARRWKSAKFRGDLDLVAWHGSTLCFIEVKTRTHRDAFAAELAVDHEKQRVLRRLARAYMQRIPAPRRPSTARFDVVSLYLTPGIASNDTWPEFVLNQGAFEWA
ncbi:YraN family protein [Edaphobacter sp. 12200R-103]|uniref:YraN family protein n=1 Tax=Edaphobacter sp. 12200R-103 TaxID=2703788 RepID=UPI00138B4B24|nr:YraN family protein [Edaphobacter sp. 12200R-103]QHS52938.1 YraN family protein [Edaphobacter sp. 12200R-103]